MKNQNNDTFSLAHTTWKCQYHVVFTPKYHRKIIYGVLRAEIGKILRELCKRKDVEIIEAYAMPDHIHMMVSIPPNMTVSSFMGYLKGKSTMMIFERYNVRVQRRNISLEQRNTVGIYQIFNVRYSAFVFSFCQIFVLQ